MRKSMFIVVAFLTVVLHAGGVTAQQMMRSADAPVVPPVAGFSEGEKILFLHTETSDPEIAKVLTDMMGSPVLVVPSLAKAPKEMLAQVYVFTNGVKGMGPLGIPARRF